MIIKYTIIHSGTDFNNELIYIRQPLEKISVQMKALEKHLQSRDYHKMLNLLHNDTNSNNISSWLLCRIAGVTDVKSPLFAVGMATLLLSAIQRQFGYHTESTNSLREAIMLAQEEQFYKILDYAMVWAMDVLCNTVLVHSITP